MVLNLKTAMELDETKKKDDHTVKDMMERMAKMNQTMQGLFEEMNEIKKEQIVAEAKK